MSCNNPMIQLLIFYDFNCRSLVMRQGGVSKGSFIYSGEDRRLLPKVKLEVVIPDSQVCQDRRGGTWRRRYLCTEGENVIS